MAVASSFVIAVLPLAAAIPDGRYRVMTCTRALTLPMPKAGFKPL
jgi:hypothetical protein